MSSPRPVPLVAVIDKMHELLGTQCNQVVRLARARVTSADATDQYVAGRQIELYQTKTEEQLARDVAEELADAVAYLAPLSQLNIRYANAVFHIARALDVVEGVLDADAR